MDHIREIVQTLSSTELTEFRNFINRIRKRKVRKDEELLELLLHEEELSREKMLEELYPENGNLEAYHATRKRLIKELSDFVYLKNAREDTSMRYQIVSYISVSHHLFKEHRERTAWKFLNKAEDLAISGKHNDLLGNIYSISVEHSLKEGAPPIEELLNKKEESHRKALIQDKAKTAHFLVRHRLHKALEQDQPIDAKMTIAQVLREYQLVDRMDQDPILSYNMVSIARSVTLATKDYYSFEPYVIGTYNELERRDGFDKFTHFYKVQFLYMITHTLYRNKKFSKANEYAILLKENLGLYGKSQLKSTLPNYQILHAQILTYGGKLEEGIALLEEALNGSAMKQNKKLFYNSTLNLSLYYFYNGQFNKGLRIFQQIHHSNSFYIKLMGKEWVLKKQLLDAMSQYEMGNDDMVESRLSAIKRDFREFLQLPQYHKATAFIDVLEKMNEDQTMLSSTTFKKTLEASFDFQEKEKEDLQAMIFFSWLKSKAGDKNFYETMLKTIKTEQ